MKGYNINRIGLFVDVSNLYYCILKRFNNRKLDYAKYMAAVKGKNNVYRAFAYGAQLDNEADLFINRLQEFGYFPKYKKPKQFENPEYRIDFGPLEKVAAQDREAQKTLTMIQGIFHSKRDTRKADWDVGMAIDIVKLANRLDVVVIGSADSDLAPVVEWVQYHGCQCIVFACNISKEMRDVADVAIEINESLLD